LALETEHRALDLKLVLKGVEALLNDPVKGTYFVAEVDGAPVGQLLLTYEWSDWRNGHFWWIQSVYVSQEFRARGIFTALFQHVHELAAQRDDVCGLRLYVEGSNARAQRTYERLGMKRTPYEVFELDFVLVPQSH
jgi:GNAT superfamily N-acetyltransferase